MSRRPVERVRVTVEFVIKGAPTAVLGYSETVDPKRSDGPGDPVWVAQDVARAAAEDLLHETAEQRPPGAPEPDTTIKAQERRGEVAEAVAHYPHDHGCAVAVVEFGFPEGMADYHLVYFHFRSGPDETPEQVEDYARAHRIKGAVRKQVLPCPLRGRTVPRSREVAR